MQLTLTKTGIFASVLLVSSHLGDLFPQYDYHYDLARSDTNAALLLSPATRVEKCTKKSYASAMTRGFLRGTFAVVLPHDEGITQRLKDLGIFYAQGVAQAEGAYDAVSAYCKSPQAHAPVDYRLRFKI